MICEFPGGDDAAVDAGEDFGWGDELVVGPFVGAVFGSGFDGVFRGTAIGAAVFAVAELVGGELFFFDAGEVLARAI